MNQVKIFSCYILYVYNLENKDIINLNSGK